MPGTPGESESQRQQVIVLNQHADLVTRVQERTKECDADWDSKHEFAGGRQARGVVRALICDDHSGVCSGTRSMRASNQYICLSRKREAGCGYTYLDFLLAQFDLTDNQSSFSLVWLGILLVSSCKDGIISGAAEELAILRFCNVAMRKLNELIVPCSPSPAFVQRRVI